MECTYTLKLNGKNVDNVFSISDLSKHFYQSTTTLKGQEILSSEKVAESVKNVLENEIIKRTNEIQSNLDKESVSSYITKENIELMKKIGLNQTRFVPEYDEENRILYFILNKLPAQFRTKFTTLKELETWANADSSNKTLFDTNYKEIKEIIEVEKLTTKLGIDMHKGLSRLLRGDDLDSVVEFIIQSNKDILDNESAWKKKLSAELQRIYGELSIMVKNGGTILSELLIDSTNESYAQIKGKLDIVIIDAEGNPHIYDLKISKNNYEDWDAVKSLSTDWQMAFYRGLLGQYIDVSSATLNIIPLTIGGIVSTTVNGKQENKLLSTNFFYKDQISLLSKFDKGLKPNGKLTLAVNKLLPPKTTIAFDETRLDAFLDELKFLLPNYEIKTTNQEYNVEKIIESAVKNGKFDIFNSFGAGDEELKRNLSVLGFNEVNNIFKYTWGNETVQEKKEKYRLAITIYLDYMSKHKNNNLISLKTAIDASIRKGLPTIEWGNKTIETNINNLLKPFMYGNHRVVSNIPELDQLGMILLQNKSDNSYSIISISSFTQEASYGDLLFGDLEYMKSLLFFNKFAKELNLNNNKIESIQVFNLQYGNYYYRSLDYEFEEFTKLMKLRKLDLNLEKVQNLKSLIEVTRDVIRNLLRSSVNSKKPVIDQLLEPITNQFNKLEDIQLQEILSKFRKEFDYLNKRTTIQLNPNDEVEYLFALLSTLEILRVQMTPFGDAIHMKHHAFAFSDFKSIFSPFLKNPNENYDENGKKIQGVIGGLGIATPDKVPSVDLRNINMLINSGNSFVRQTFYKQSTVLGKLTRQFFKDINYSPTEQNWLGNYREKFEPFWVKENGDISNIWRVKNPYTDPMKAAEKKYLIEILFQIKKYELGISDNDPIDLTSLETLSKTNAGLKVLAKIQSEEYFLMPLIKNQQITRAGVFFKDGFKGMADKGKLLGEDLADAFDQRELSEEEKVNIKKTSMGYYEMYNIYEMQSPSFKKEMIDKNSPKQYELNLDIIAHRVAFNKIRQNIINKILPTINAYMWQMKLRAGISNTEITKELDYIVKRIDLALNDSPISDDEMDDVLKAITPVKRITTAGMLAFRPVLLLKELTIGLYKGIALASTKLYGTQQFSYKSYFASMQKMMNIDKKFSTEWNMIDGINNFYGLANRDVNSAPQKMQTNRRGVLMGMSPWMYSMNTIPDYYNRVSLFVAKMIEDGSYDAHSMVDGYPVYDATKDKRFELYFKERHLHMNSNGKYIHAVKNEEYNKQRNLYLLTMEEVNEDLQRLNFPILVEEKDLLSHAYSEKERLSFKSFTDTIYGYYDKDSQSMLHNTWYGIVFLQFMQFWPGKMNQWFGKKVSAEESIMGEHKQKTQKNDDGTESLLWRTPIYSQINPEEIIGYNETTENTGDPALAWIGTPHEGLAQSIMQTLKYALTGDMGKFKNDKLLQKRFMYGIADGLLMMLIFGLFSSLLAGWIADNGTDGIDGQTMSLAYQVNQRVVNESNLYLNTFEALKTTPAFIGFGTKVLGDGQDVIEGNKTMSDFSRNFKALEIFNLGQL